MKNTGPINTVEKEFSLELAKIELLPDFIEIETSTYCNRACSWCPNSVYNRGKLQKLISNDLFKKIIKDLKKIKYKNKIALHNFNEPLFDQNILKHIETIKRELPEVQIMIFTNGDILDKAYCEKLEKRGVSIIKITIQDAILAKDYRYIFQGYLDKLGFNGKIKDVSDSLGRKFKIFFGKTEIIYYIPYKEMLTSRGGILSGMEEYDKSSLCFLPFSSNAIDYQGNMKICCEIYSGYKLHKKRGFIGNLKKWSFVELWFSNLFNNFRKELLYKNIDNGICSHCPKNGIEIDWMKLNKWIKFLC